MQECFSEVYGNVAEIPTFVAWGVNIVRRVIDFLKDHGGCKVLQPRVHPGDITTLMECRDIQSNIPQIERQCQKSAKALNQTLL